jgi:hypothetical protein
VKTETPRAPFTNREFVAAIRAELDDAGHQDIPISRQWFEERADGVGICVNAPVGAALTVPLKVMDSFQNAKRPDDLKHVREVAMALVTLKRAERMLENYAKDVRTAAIAEIASARAEGLDILLEDVGFKPVSASNLTGKDWKDAVQYVVASVEVRHTSFYLRPTTSELWIGKPIEIVKELADIREQQRERQNRLAELDALRADLIVDQITLDLLATHGLNAGAVLERVWKEQCVNLTVQHDGQDTALSLVSADGEVSAFIMLEDAIWNGEHLWFRGDEHLKDHRHLIGGSVGDLVRHPVFASRTIVDVFHRHADHIVFDLSDKVLFDIDSGFLRRAERLVA